MFPFLANDICPLFLFFADKDNDLRCRINKRAKLLFGEDRQAERAAWAEAEFQGRKAKRVRKETVQALERRLHSMRPGMGAGGGGGVDGSSSGDNGVYSTPGAGAGTGLHGESGAASVLLTNALLGAVSSASGHGHDPAAAAQALKSALDSNAADPRPFTDALKAMAADPVIMDAISTLLDVPAMLLHGGTGSGANSPEEEDPYAAGDASSTELRDEPPPPPPPPRANKSNGNMEEGEGAEEVLSRENEIIDRLNCATALLNKMNEARQAVSVTADDTTRAAEEGGGTGESQGALLASLGAANMDESGIHPVHGNVSGSTAIEAAAVPALAGGAISGVTAAVATNEHHQHVGGGGGGVVVDMAHPEAQASATHLGTDLSATLQRILQQVLPTAATASGRDGQPAAELSMQPNTIGQNAAGGGGHAGDAPLVAPLLAGSGPGPGSGSGSGSAWDGGGLALTNGSALHSLPHIYGAQDAANSAAAAATAQMQTAAAPTTQHAHQPQPPLSGAAPAFVPINHGIGAYYGAATALANGLTAAGAASAPHASLQLSQIVPVSLRRQRGAPEDIVDAYGYPPPPGQRVLTASGCRRKAKT